MPKDIDITSTHYKKECKNLHLQSTKHGTKMSKTCILYSFIQYSLTHAISIDKIKLKTVLGGRILAQPQ